MVNENSLSALKSIAPHYMLGQGKRVQMTEPNLWSFARSSIKAGCMFSRVDESGVDVKANLQKGVLSKQHSQISNKVMDLKLESTP